MRSGARLHGNYTWRHRSKHIQQVLALHHTSHLHAAALIDPVQSEHVLG
jgi:hypothetical protein